MLCSQQISRKNDCIVLFLFFVLLSTARKFFFFLGWVRKRKEKKKAAEEGEGDEKKRQLKPRGLIGFRWNLNEFGVGRMRGGTEEGDGWSEEGNWFFGGATSKQQRWQQRPTVIAEVIIIAFFFFLCKCVKFLSNCALNPLQLNRLIPKILILKFAVIITHADHYCCFIISS